MAKDRNGSTHEGEEDDRREESKRDRHRKSKRKKDESSSSGGSSDSEDARKKKKKRGSRSSRRRRRDSSESVEGSYSDSFSDSGSESDGGDELESESEELRRRKRKERRREREHEKERKRRKEREKEKKRKRDKEKRRKKTDKDQTKKNKEKDLGKTRAVTNSWGKYGIIRETDMWNKRPEFTAWLAEVKKVNLESLANWEEKQMFKEFMEDHNTATFPSKKYYDLDVYYRRKIEKEIKKGYKKVSGTERTVFNDEEQRRQELLIERERQKEEQVVTLKRNMQSGMAQAMKDQARLREEMAYQYKLGNFEAAAAIQKRLDPDVAM